MILYGWAHVAASMQFKRRECMFGRHYYLSFLCQPYTLQFCLRVPTLWQIFEFTYPCPIRSLFVCISSQLVLVWKYSKNPSILGTCQLLTFSFIDFSSHGLQSKLAHCGLYAPPVLPYMKERNSHNKSRKLRVTNTMYRKWKDSSKLSLFFLVDCLPGRHLNVLIPYCFTDNNWCLIRPNRNHKYCPTDGHSARHVRKSELKWREIEEKCQFDVCLFF